MTSARSAALLSPVVAILAVAALTSCSADAPEQRQLSASLVDSGISEEVATCAAEALYDNMTDEQIEQVVQRGGGGAPVDDPDRVDDTADRVREALGACRAFIETTLPIETTTVPAGASTTVTPSAPDADGAVIDTPAP